MSEHCYRTEIFVFQILCSNVEAVSWRFYNRIKRIINHNTFQMCGNINWRSQQSREISVTGFRCHLMILSLLIGGKSWKINGYILKCFYLFVTKS